MRTGNQIILDDRLLDDKKAGERNFTIAHECGHDLINWQDPSYSPQTVVNYRIKSSGKSLVTEDDFKEWQANVVWTHHGSRKVVWRCTTRMDYGKEKCNDSFTIEEEGLHQAILKAISNLSSRKEELKDELKAALSITLLDTGADMSITSLEQQIKEQENDLMRVVRITAERGNKGEFETEFKRISDNIKDLKRLLEVEKTKIRPKLDIESRLEDLFTTIDRANVDVKEFNNQIIRQLIAQIRIDNESKMTVILTNGYRFEAEL